MGLTLWIADNLKYPFDPRDVPRGFFIFVGNKNQPDMKKIILLLLGLFTITAAQAQDRAIFTRSTPEECITAIDTLLKDAKRVYEFVDFYNSGNRYYFDFAEADPADPDNPARVKAVFVKVDRGANPALEIKGTTVYEMDAIRGKFLDLFPIWKKYVDPHVNMELLAEKGKSGYTPLEFPNPDGSGQKFSFIQDNQSPDIWLLNRGVWIKRTRI